MYRKNKIPDNFKYYSLTFSGRLRSDNRWVMLAKLVPWNEFEEKYAQQFASSGLGAPAKPFRMALGALIIKEKCGYSDEETVEQLRENPYLQYFIGLNEYQDDAPFDPSMLVHFRKRLTEGMLREINDVIIARAKKDKDKHDNPPGKGPGGNQGQLILDASCAPADIRYPTDLTLLNEAREKLEGIIDTLNQPQRGKVPKPRTYRRKARKDYLQVAKQRKPSRKALRKAIGKQLRYTGRDLRIINSLMETMAEPVLTRKQWRDLRVIHTLHQQQKTMYEAEEHRIEDRIVSISQPHVRPIVRGKAGAGTEFGAKIAISLVSGYARIEKLSWDNYNEGNTLPEQVKAYQQRYGVYPEVVIADQIYRTRENRSFCKEIGARLSGPLLGRPKDHRSREQRQIEYRESCIRNGVEGKFGEGKRRYGLGCIMAKLKETSESVIAVQFLVMNLQKRLRAFFLCLLQRLRIWLFPWQRMASLLGY